MSKSKYQEFLSKPELNFWVPIITSAVMVASSFFLLYTRVELLNQKMDNIAEKIEFLTGKYASVEQRVGQLSLQVRELETIEGIRHNTK